MKKGCRNQDIIKMNENVKISKGRRQWFCAACHEPIKDGALSILIQDVLFYDNKYSAAGFGIRIHLDCGKKLGEDLDHFANHKEKYRAVEGWLK